MTALSREQVTAIGEPVVPEWTFGDRLRKVRRMCNMTQVEFAELLGYPTPTVQSWEVDKAAPRGADLVLVALAVRAAVGVEADWLLADLASRLTPAQHELVDDAGRRLRIYQETGVELRRGEQASDVDADPAGAVTSKYPVVLVAVPDVTRTPRSPARHLRIVREIAS